MSCILNIETSTDVCSVAISDNGQVIFNKEDHSGPNHAVKLGVYVDEALSFIDGHGISLEAVAVSCGPGSYTGLRIGVSMAKGICYGRGVKLIAVPTLELLAVPVLLGEHPEEEDALIVPMLDARRMEVYTALYDEELHAACEVEARVVETPQWLLDTGKDVYYFGDGAAKCQEVLDAPSLHCIAGIVPEAKYMGLLAERMLADGYKGADVAYYEPFYLKEFVAAAPHIKGL